jgi:hypothetical protein
MFGKKGKSMQNVKMTVKGDILTIEVNLTKDLGPSSTGKTRIVASTEGPVTVSGSEIKVNMTAFKKKGN